MAAKPTIQIATQRVPKSTLRMEGRSVIPAGMNATASTEGPACNDDVISLTDRSWQPEALLELEGKRKRRLLAPTGSGKSVLIRAVVWHDLMRLNAEGKRTTKVIIAVPQIVIGFSFRETRIRLPDGRVIAWAPRLQLFDGDGTIESLIAFIRRGPGGTPSSRILVCTHSTLVRAHSKLMERGESWNANGEVSLVIDESHLSQQDTYFLDGEKKVQINCLGHVIAHWLEHYPGPIMLATATWLRGDLTSIVSKDQLSQFDSTYQYTADRYINDLRHIKEIVFSYALGTPEEVLKVLYQTPGRIVMDFMRPPSMAEGDDKFDRLDRRLSVLGPYPVGGDFNTHKGQFGTLTSCHLLSEDGVKGERSDNRRKARKKALLGAIRKGVGVPDYTATMNIGKSGFDNPFLTTILIDGKRNSIPDVLQMIGRVLRDLRGKHRVEVITVLDVPNPNDPGYVSKIRDTVKIILASLVIEWQFRTIKFPKIEDPEVRTVVENLFKNPEFTSDLVATAVNEKITSNPNRSDEDVIAGVQDKVVKKLVASGVIEAGSATEAAVKDTVSEFIPQELGRKTREARELHSADEISDSVLAAAGSSVFGCLNYYTFSLTHGDGLLSGLRTELEASRKIPYADLVREVKRLGITAATYDARYTEIEGAPQYPNKEYPEWAGWPKLFGARGPSWSKAARRRR